MISWLLAAVLLSAHAITTPASTEPTAPRAGAPAASRPQAPPGPGRSQAPNETLASSMWALDAAGSLAAPADGQHQLKRPQQIYTNQFVIQVKGGEQEVRKLAERHGFVYLNHILADYYHLEHRRLAKRSTSDADMSQLEISIEDEPQVSGLSGLLFN